VNHFKSVGDKVPKYFEDQLVLLKSFSHFDTIRIKEK